MPLRGVFFIKSRKIKILALTYSIALITALGFYGFTGNRSLEAYRLAAKYSSGRAFEETVYAVDSLSRSLEKSVYATDGGMCAKLCGEIYAGAAAAESAMSTLPFTTHELEQLSAFLNMTGDYAYTLSSGSTEGFDEEEIRILSRLSETAADFSGTLRDIQSSVNNGDIMMDSREEQLMNVGVDENPTMLSDKLLEYEEGFAKPEKMEYDGKYSKQVSEIEGSLTEDEMKALAADFAGVSPDALKLEYEYEGTSGRKCYSVDELMICVSPSGVETMGQSRLVSEVRMDIDEAEQRAKKFLSEKGFSELELMEISENGAVTAMKFAKTEGDALCLDKSIKIAVAMDDGSIYSFNAEKYDERDTNAEWLIDSKKAEESLPDSLRLHNVRKVIKESSGGRELACYEMSCQNEDGRGVIIYVDAETGRQNDIFLS